MLVGGGVGKHCFVTVHAFIMVITKVVGKNNHLVDNIISLEWVNYKFIAFIPSNRRQM